MGTETTANQQWERLLTIGVALGASVVFLDSAFFTTPEPPVVIRTGSGLSAVGMLTGVVWLAARWVRDR
ncbi:MAG: hypothetical protein J07HB67_01511 [halophilic archaeon J07HB67]|jgi:hypothetical protein|nr:MAG: hypothetical protein J07HB67_01511 [halophilic archaeon J07HB67]